MADLPQALLQILGSEAARLIVIEKVEGSRRVLGGFGAAVFVHDHFLEELKARPFWFGPELARRIVRGGSPLLSERQVREANARGGLNLIAWEGFARPELAADSEVQRQFASAFVENFRGFLLKEVIASQSTSEDRVQWTLATGGWLWDASAGRYVDHFDQGQNGIAQSPHVLGITRELDRRRPGSWIGTLFEYSPPRCSFTRAERKQLAAALCGDGETDLELAVALRVSVPTIKKMWLSIYARASANLPEVIQDNSSPGNSEATSRGKEKRRRLIAYLRDHPEELRPVSRKFRQQGRQAVTGNFA